MTWVEMKSSNVESSGLVWLDSKGVGVDESRDIALSSSPLYILQ